MNFQTEILDKNALRRLVRQLKAQMPECEKKSQADAILSKLEQNAHFKNARNIALYWSLNDEVDTHQFIEKWHRQKNIYLPAVIGNDLAFRQYTGIDNMQAGVFSILEPTGNKLNNIADIDLVIVPGMAFDTHNNRMGRGRGFYDRILSTTKAYKIGIAFECQLFRQIPANSNDIAMDEVISGISTIK